MKIRNVILVNSPKIGDKILVQTRLEGKKICVVDMINNRKIHFKNKTFGLEVNLDRISPLLEPYKDANFFYQSFN
jgi:hypothetical protein